MTSRPAHVRLAILVDADGVYCGPCMRRKGELCDMFGGILAHEPGVGWGRRDDCLSATAAQELDDAIVKAAERWRDADEDITTPPGGKLLDELADAIDAKRAALSKGKRDHAK